MPFKGYAETGNLKRSLFRANARISLGRIATVTPRLMTAKGFRAILFHPDYTVGSGISPDLLTFRHKRNGSARGLRDFSRYRRWGISPRPENTLKI
jgi:hypothetical protein